MWRWGWLLLGIMLGMSSCMGNPLWDFLKGLDDGSSETTTDDRSISPERVIEPTSTFALAVGGVAPGRDELVLDRTFGAGDVLVCTADPPILLFYNRSGFDSGTAGGGYQMIPTEEGLAAVTCSISGVALDETYEVTIPPQNLIQILLGEARTQLDDEATIEDGHVTLTSTSPTATAIGAVIRNRIRLIEERADPELFNADSGAYNANPPVSFYDAVINAPHQFLPVEPSDPSYPIFDDAQDRNFLDATWLAAYDQAVLSAAAIFNEDASDPTGGAFAFRSPTEEEWQDGTEVTDDNFPALAPLHIVIVPDVWTYDDGRPAFIFVRSRDATANLRQHSR
ncbi:MAG: hypothetical protein HY465_06060 [Deltaproteobacteria bacterium]|nr:hypothetical protein [Deltaproteobacteria bacterium]